MKKTLSLLAIMMTMAVTSALASVSISASSTTCKVGESITISYSWTPNSGSSESDFLDAWLFVEGNYTGDSNDNTSGSFTYTPTTAGTHELYVEVDVDGEGDGYEDWSDLILVTVTEDATSVTLSEDDTEQERYTSYADGKLYNISLTRSLKQDNWNSLCLPFSMTAEEIAANKIGTVMKMTGITDNVVNFETVSDIEEGLMYIVKPASDYTGKINVTNKTVETEAGDDETYFCDLNFGQSFFVPADGYQVTGDFYSFDVKSDVYEESIFYCLSNSKFYEIDSPVTFKGYRWLIYAGRRSSSEAKTGLGISFDGAAPTAISSVNSEQLTVNNGKYIQNGKLVIVKDGKTYNAAGQLVK